MFIVKNKIKNLYFKRGNIRSWYDAKLVSREDATIFRSISGIKNCLGKTVHLEKVKILKNGRRVFSKKILDETTWKIEEITF